MQENRLVVDKSHRSWDDDSTGPKDENTEEAEVCSISNSIDKTSMLNFKTLKHLWRPNLEIYGLEDFHNHKILGEMAGLRISKKKVIKYDTKYCCLYEFESPSFLFIL